MDGGGHGRRWMDMDMEMEEEEDREEEEMGRRRRWGVGGGECGQMDGEADWWTTSGNIGLPPLARVMGVGRQQQQMDMEDMEDMVDMEEMEEI